MPEAIIILGFRMVSIAAKLLERMIEAPMILERVIHSDFINNEIIPVLYDYAQRALRDSNTEPIELAETTIERARKEFEHEYRHIEITTMQTADLLCKEFIGHDPSIALIRSGLVSLFNEPKGFYKLRTDFTGRMEEIMMTPDIELVSSADPNEKGYGGSRLTIARSSWEFTPLSEPIDCGFVKLRARNKAGFKATGKIVDKLFGLNSPGKITGIDGITDFAAVRIIGKERQNSYELLESLIAMPEIEIIPESIKDYYERPKGEYRAIHAIGLIPCNPNEIHPYQREPSVSHPIEIQIRDIEANQIAEKSPLAHHDQKYEREKRDGRMRIDHITNNAYSNIVEQLDKIIVMIVPAIRLGYKPKLEKPNSFVG